MAIALSLKMNDPETLCTISLSMAKPGRRASGNVSPAFVQLLRRKAVSHPRFGEDPAWIGGIIFKLGAQLPDIDA